MSRSKAAPLSLFATTPKGLELLLVDELKGLGASMAAEKLAGVAFSGDLTLAYKVCLWSRLANRVLLNLAKVPAMTPEALYQGVQSIDWREHVASEGTMAVHFIASQSTITHTLFGAQKVKDAIVDQFRKACGIRPSVDTVHPDVSVYVYLYRDIASIYIDLSGQSLHRRGYRLSAGAAPLKENLAAAVLIRAGWPAIAKQGGTLLDPMCGSGTLLIEAAMMAADVAPGLARDYFGFEGWLPHQAAIWASLIAEAALRQTEGMKQLPTMVGFDNDPEAIAMAFENIERAGLMGKVHVEKRELNVFAPKASDQPGLVMTNPPYGERLGEVEALKLLYAELGERLKEAFQGWKAAIFTANPDLGKQMGLRAKRYYALFNGALPCKLLLFDVEPAFFIDRSPESENERRIHAAKRKAAQLDAGDLAMFVNRMRKNIKHMRRQLARQRLDCYRVYDADIPEYAFVIEVTQEAVRVQEYQAPRSVDKQTVMSRQQHVLAILPELLDVPPSQVFFSVVSKRRS
ncbi:MAG: hypothetical protein A3E85_00735 [Gammaproteobacteria bacterium RIFCSPHIGHO2_12_FULL_45_12]|nr:MAG: hypothetical protein A3E85_00735 [Gammaproteobacteria bacterium RIFCSPHIGHO2_12_FULL_45_12]